MKKEIKIQIPNNLSKEKEALVISKKLIQKFLSRRAQNKEQARIGNEITIIEPETIIRITRVNKEKPIELCNCSVCHSEYQSDMANHCFTNYGGNVRKLSVCSIGCRDTLIAAFPGRIASKKKNLASIRTF